MKIKYIIIFVILLITGNFIRLFIEDKKDVNIEINEDINYNKNEVKIETDFTKNGKKYDVNFVTYEELLKLGFNKSKATKLLEYREKVGLILTIKELKNIPKFGESGFKISSKYLIVDSETIKNKIVNLNKFNINKVDESDLKLVGFTKQEIKKIKKFLENEQIRSSIELEKLIGKKRYVEIKEKIKFND